MWQTRTVTVFGPVASSTRSWTVPEVRLPPVSYRVRVVLPAPFCTTMG